MNTQSLNDRLGGGIIGDWGPALPSYSITLDNGDLEDSHRGLGWSPRITSNRTHNQCKHELILKGRCPVRVARIDFKKSMEFGPITEVD